MKSTRENYCYVDQHGDRTLPSKHEISEIRNNGLTPLLILDSNICLDIIKLVSHKTNARIDKKRLFNLLEYVQKTKIEITPLTGLIELCYNTSSFQINEEKFWDMNNKIDFVKSFPIKFLKKCDFDYAKNYRLHDTPKLQKNDIESFKPMLNTSYACLLKIRDISLNGMKINQAESNTMEFLEWCERDLGIIMGLEIQLALKFFSTPNDFRKMLWIDGNKDEIKKKLWGTSWDIFHSRISCNSINFSKMIKERRHTIFATNDTALHKLLATMNLEVSINLDDKPTLIHSFDISSKLKDSFQEQFKTKMLTLFKQRFNIKQNYNENKVLGLIENLEIANGI